MEDSAGPRPNKLHQIQQTRGHAQGVGSSGGGASPKKRRSMIDAALSAPRYGTAKKQGGGGSSNSNKPRNGSDDTKRRRKGGPRNGGGRGGKGTPGGTKSGGGGKSGARQSNKRASSDKAATATANDSRPPPIVCSALETLASRIRQRPSSSLEDIAKEQINDLPTVPYTYGAGVNDKRIVVITDVAGSRSAVASIRSELQQQAGGGGGGGGGGGSANDARSAFQYLGFDVEIKPKFHKGGQPNPVALVQLATKTTAYLFRLKFQGMGAPGSAAGGGAWSSELSNLLSDGSIIKVGVGIRNDVQTLQNTYGANVCGDSTSYLDLTELVKIKWPLIRRCGLRNLTATVLGWRLSKAQQMKNWEMKDMTNAMLEYAAADAFVALDLLDAIVP